VETVDIISYHLNKIIASHQLSLREKDVDDAGDAGRSSGEF
jgi:hypothetical protein